MRQNGPLPGPLPFGRGEESSGAAPDSAVFCRLAQLTPAQYDRVRKSEAKQLGIRVETLDAEVARGRAQIAIDAQIAVLESAFGANGNGIGGPGADAGPSRSEPWPEPVNGAEVLHQVAERFNLQIFLPPGGSVAITLWIGHAHAHGAFSHTPRLNLASPKENCGKTTTLDLIANLIPRSLRTENLRVAVANLRGDGTYPNFFPNNWSNRSKIANVRMGACVLNQKSPFKIRKALARVRHRESQVR